jgi:hypothetical protein
LLWKSSDLKGFIFWDTTPCSPAKVNNVSEEHIASIFRVEVKAKQETSRSRRKTEINLSPASNSFFLGLLDDLQDGVDMLLPPKYRHLPKLYGVTTQKSAVFIATSVRASNSLTSPNQHKFMIQHLHISKNFPIPFLLCYMFMKTTSSIRQ